jgi:hypothetical protein
MDLRKIDCWCVDGINLAQDMVQWRTRVNALELNERWNIS